MLVCTVGLGEDLEAYMRPYRGIDIGPYVPQDYLFCVSRVPIDCAVANFQIVSENLLKVRVFRPIPTRKFFARPAPGNADFDRSRYPRLEEYPVLAKIADIKAKTGELPLLHCIYDSDVRESELSLSFTEEERFYAYFLEFGREFAHESFEIRDDCAELIAVEMAIYLVKMWA